MEPFPLPMVFVAWATSPGRDWEGGSIGGGLFTPARAAKVATIAFQLGEFTSQHLRWAHEAGFFAVAWNVVGPDLSQRLDALEYTDSSGAKRGVDGVMVQVEGDGQFAGAVAGLTAIEGRGLPTAVVTTYGGLVVLRADGSVDLVKTAARWKQLAALGATACFVECYAADDPVVHADLDRMLAQGTVYGIPAGVLYPVCGTYRSELPAAYKGLGNHGRDFAMYLAEAMSTDQWKAWGAFAPPPPPPPDPTPPKLAYWQVKVGSRVLHEVRAKTWPDGSTGLGKTIAWLGANEDVVRRARAISVVHVTR